jgi:hypothetical protein
MAMLRTRPAAVTERIAAAIAQGGDHPGRREPVWAEPAGRVGEAAGDAE